MTDIDDDGFPIINEPLVITNEPLSEVKIAQDDKPVTPEEKLQVTKAMAGTDIMSTDNGMLIGKTIEGLYRIAKVMFLSKMVPKQYDSIEKIMTGMQYAVSLQLNPFISLRQISVVNGQPSLWGDLPLGLVRRSGQLESITEFFIDKNYKEISFENKNLAEPMWAAVCKIKRLGYPEKTFTFTEIDYARQGAGVEAIWKKYKPTMFMRKSRGTGLKSEFSDILEGVVIAEYDYNILPEAGGAYNVSHDGKPSQEEKINKFEDKLKGSKPDIETTPQ